MKCVKKKKLNLGEFITSMVQICSSLKCVEELLERQLWKQTRRALRRYSTVSTQTLNRNVFGCKCIILFQLHILFLMARLTFKSKRCPLSHFNQIQSLHLKMSDMIWKTKYDPKAPTYKWIFWVFSMVRLKIHAHPTLTSSPFDLPMLIIFLLKHTEITWCLK